MNKFLLLLVVLSLGCSGQKSLQHKCAAHCGCIVEFYQGKLLLDRNACMNACMTGQMLSDYQSACWNTSNTCNEFSSCMAR